MSTLQYPTCLFFSLTHVGTFLESFGLICMLYKVLVSTGASSVSPNHFNLAALWLLPLTLVGIFGHRGVSFSNSWSFDNIEGFGVTLTLILGLSCLLLGSSSARTSSQFLGFEGLCCLLCLRLVWLLLYSSQTLLVVILWFEVSGLLAVLLLGFTGWAATSQSSPSLSAYRGVGLIEALLLFIWVNGAATVLLLWGWLVIVADSLWFDSFFSTSSPLFATSSEAFASTLVRQIFSLAILLKLMLQPFFFLLFSFYSLLPLSSFVYYLAGYYCWAVTAALLLIVGPLASVITTGGVFLLLVLSISVFVLGFALDTLLDVNAALAFSTAINLSLLLAALVGLWV